MNVLNERGETVELPSGNYPACGHTHPGSPVKPSAHNKAQRGYHGGNGNGGYYTAYYFHGATQRAFFVPDCPHSASHLRPDVGSAALRIAVAQKELADAERALAALQA